MFREIAIVTFTAGMLGTSAATLTDAFDSNAAAPPPPAIERAPAAAAPAQADQPDPKRDPDLVAVELSQR